MALSTLPGATSMRDRRSQRRRIAATTSVPDHVGERGLRARAVRRPSRRRRPRITAWLSALPKTAPPLTSLTTSRSQPLRASLARAWSSTEPVSSPVSAAKPTIDAARARARSWEISARMSGFCVELDRRGGAVVGLLDLGVADRGRPEVGRGGGHHHGVGGGRRADDRVAQLAGGLDPDHLDAGRVGQRHVGADQGDLGAAGGGRAGERVALPPRGAVAEEAHRVEVLAGAAGGDHDVAAGQVARASSRSRPAEHLERELEDLVGLGQPALAGVGAGQPALGRLDRRRRRARAAWRRWPGWRRAPTSRCASPGRSTTGQRAVSRVLVSRSSARPWAALASRSAVAGATTTRSASWPIRTWGTSWTSSQTSVATGLPESAAQVGAPTNSSAAAVGTTVTSCPDSVNSRSSSQAL